MPSHLGVRLPATPAPPGALDDEELFIVRLEKLALNSGTTGGARKMTQNAPKTASKLSKTESEAPPTVARKCANLSLRDHGDVQPFTTTLSMYCNCGTSTVSALTKPCTCRKTTGASTTDPRTALWNTTTSAQLALWILPLWHN